MSAVPDPRRPTEYGPRAAALLTPAFAPPRWLLSAAGAALAAAIALAGLVAGQAAGLLGGSTPAELARMQAAQVEAERRIEHQAFTEVYQGQEAQELRVENGETLVRILTRAGAAPVEADAAMSSVSSVFDPRRIRPGQPVNVYFRRSREAATLAGLAFHSQPGATVTANRITAGGFAAREVEMPITFENARISARWRPASMRARSDWARPTA